LQIKIFKSSVKENPWMRMINVLEQAGHDVYPTAEDCDRAVILGGRHENPTVFNCERVLVYNEVEWKGRWGFFRPVLEEYYDKMIDVTRMSFLKTAQKIIEQCA